MSRKAVSCEQPVRAAHLDVVSLPSKTLSSVGLVGVLREARVRGFIPQLRPPLVGLRGAGYYPGDELTRRVLATVGEGEA